MYSVELVETGVKQELDKASIISAVINLRNLATFRITTEISNNYIVVNCDDLGFYMEQSDDDLYALYSELYDIIKRKSQRYCYSHCNTRYELEVLEEVEDGNLRVYNIFDLSDAKRGSEVYLKNISFVNYDINESKAFRTINKVLPLRVDAIITTGDLINTFNQETVDIADNQLIFVVLDYNSEEVKKMYNKFKEWSNENA